MDGWNTSFLLGRPIFRGYVSFREGNSFHFPDSILNNFLQPIFHSIEKNIEAQIEKKTNN